MSAIYDALTTLCKRSGGTWTGDIHVLRRLLPTEKLPTNIVATKKLETLQRRGLITYQAERVSSNRVIWTVTLVDQANFDVYFDALGFVETVDQVRQKRKTPVTAMCTLLNIDGKTLHRVMTGEHQDLYTDTMAVLAVWSGVDPRQFIKRRTYEDNNWRH